MKFYTQDDVVRWEAANSRAIALREGFLANPPARLDIDMQYALLGQAYSAIGLTAIAQSKYQVAFSYLTLAGWHWMAAVLIMLKQAIE